MDRATGVRFGYDLNSLPTEKWHSVCQFEPLFMRPGHHDIGVWNRPQKTRNAVYAFEVGTDKSL